MSKNLYVIAGAEGSGKTTFIKNLLESGWFPETPVINVDLLAETLDKNLSGAEKTKLATEMCKSSMTKLAEQKKTFILEAPFSERSEFAVLKSFKAFGYAIHTVYLATSVPVINERRIKKRAAITGEAEMKDFRDKYRKSMRNIKQLIEISTNILIYDCSDENLKKVYAKTDSGEEWIDQRYKVISWVNEYIPNVL